MRPTLKNRVSLRSGTDLGLAPRDGAKLTSFSLVHWHSHAPVSRGSLADRSSALSSRSSATISSKRACSSAPSGTSPPRDAAARPSSSLFSGLLRPPRPSPPRIEPPPLRSRCICGVSSSVLPSRRGKSALRSTT
eukprot:scaffold90639_cov66-Phaeocystis_antarctica.AAC.4